MKAWSTKRNNTIYQVLSGRNNCYFIPAKMGNILVDTGMKGAYSRLNGSIDKLLLEATHVDYLVLTHSHFDHCQNANSIQQQNNCKVLMSEKEASFVSQGYTPIPNGTYAFSRLLVSIGRRMKFSWLGYEPFDVSKTIGKDWLWMDDEIKIKLINTPGHSAGSISLIIDDEIAIVGDVMINTFGESIFPPFADDVPQLFKSWKKLLDTDCRLFLPGHRPVITRRWLERQYQKYRKNGN